MDPLSVECPTCDQQPGERCICTSPFETGYLLGTHRARVRKAEEE